ncbi:sugar kinase [Aeromicrobium chenweiae]|uniref:Sugar kinase n=1 Tax=Aeromicrobium chenweiae TaxID=2079793 RepID=A0A2S0WHP8_9ACTN|nr:sugar kinase [Aeromicrobium chenweiae]AWB90847.1 sugar kinase [Aeromicrobium chenweiae]TGN31110.1 sugar kinase [Aeromicrobium chenweiae]
MSESRARGGVVTLGETMALVSTSTIGPIINGASLCLGIGGAESNVAIALSRLGVDATWIGKVGDDPFGDLVLREIRAEGVRTVGVRDADAPTALMFKERRTQAETRIEYYRAGLAGSRLSVADVDDDLIRGAAVLHLTGISPALSDDMREVTDHAIAVAKDAGVTISFDLNYRGKLWTTEDAAEAYRRIIPDTDIVFGGDEEAAIALGADGTPLALAHGLVEMGAGEAVVKLGSLGAVAVVDGQEHERAAIPIQALDTVGAGDAFVAGYLADYLLGEPVATRLTTAVTVGAYACLVPGDWEGLPRRSELARLTSNESVDR